MTPIIIAVIALALVFGAEADARDYLAVLTTCLEYLHAFGGVVLKYPYSAGGKGARVILNTWEIRDVYDGLIHDY